jgi:hypothetical protein
MRHKSWKWGALVGGVAASAALFAVASASGTIVPVHGSMEGDMKANPGTVISGGFSVTMPGSHAAAVLTLQNATITIPARCGSGAVVGNVVITLAQPSINIGQNDGAWYPSGNQSDPSVLQGSATVPDLCSGGQVRMDQGADFSANAISSNSKDAVHLRFHYGKPNSSFSWSGTTSFIPDNPPTAVRLSSLAASRSNTGVAVTWRSPHGAGLLGFNLYRQDGARRVQVNTHLIVDSGASAGSYRFFDRHAPAHATRYWVQAVGLDGSRTWLGSVAAEHALP